MTPAEELFEEWWDSLEREVPYIDSHTDRRLSNGSLISKSESLIIFKAAIAAWTTDQRGILVGLQQENELLIKDAKQARKKYDDFHRDFTALLGGKSLMEFGIYLQELVAARDSAKDNLRQIIDLFIECDRERLNEVYKSREESEKWANEHDMYGWNFHQGVASGKVWASIIYYRIKRLAESLLRQ